jgi:flagellar basal body-associated protein FliL
MAIRKRGLFYFGLIIFAVGIILFAFLVIQGPHSKIPEQSVEIRPGKPLGPQFENIEPGDSIELNFEATEPVNVLLMKAEDAGDYFNNPVSNVKPIVLAEETTGDTINHEFETSGDWDLYFENPQPPSPNNPPAKVKYWGTLKKQADDLLFYYLNIVVALILVILGLVLLFSSRTKKPKQKPKTKQKSETKQKPKKKNNNHSANKNE